MSGEYHLYGPYQGPFGFGTLTIDNGIAYGEPFETASGSLRFEGNGVRIDSIQMRKSGGTAEGAAFVGWNGTYSFNATGRRIPHGERAGDGVSAGAADRRFWSSTPTAPARSTCRATSSAGASATSSSRMKASAKSPDASTSEASR